MPAALHIAANGILINAEHILVLTTQIKLAATVTSLLVNGMVLNVLPSMEDVQILKKPTLPQFVVPQPTNLAFYVLLTLPTLRNVWTNHAKHVIVTTLTFALLKLEDVPNV